MEKKTLRYFDTEMRAVDHEDGTMEAEGYALKFDKETQIGSGHWAYIEKIDKISMTTADTKDVIFDFNHSWDYLLARTINGSLTLEVDDIGLKMRATFVDTAQGKDVYKMIKEGLINRMSFAAEVKRSEWQVDENGIEMDRRTITEFGRFFDVSAVTFPAYDDTIIATRSDLEIIDREVKEHFEKREYQKQMIRLNKIIGGNS